MIPCVLFGMKLFERLVEHVIDLIVAEILLEVVGIGFLVDFHIFDAKHFCKIFPVFFRDVVGEGAMVSTSCQNPCTCTDFEGGLWNPQGGSHGQIRHGFWLYALNLLRDETEAVAKVDNSGLDSAAGF